MDVVYVQEAKDRPQMMILNGKSSIKTILAGDPLKLNETISVFMHDNANNIKTDKASFWTPVDKIMKAATILTQPCLCTTIRRRNEDGRKRIYHCPVRFEKAKNMLICMQSTCKQMQNYSINGAKSVKNST